MARVDDPPDSARPEECESCRFETTALKPYRSARYEFGVNAGKGPTHKWLCLLCASTPAGNAQDYPEQYREGRDKDILETICHVANAILQAIEKSNTKGSSS